MKKAIVFTAIVLLAGLAEISKAQSDSLKTQTDSLVVDKGNNFIYYFETGFGFNTRGMNFDMSFFAGSSNGLGGTLNFMAGYVNLKDIPADYYGLFRWFKPTNNFTAISPALTLKFTNPKQSFRFGLEAGPSFMHWNLVELELNPDYPDLFEYKYNKIESQKNTTGCYLALKGEIPALQFLGCSFTVFGIINNVEPLIGFDITITLGKIKRKLD
jgi:hypothetical protein